MAGTWVKGPEPPHSCQRPGLEGVAAGSVWRCECGMAHMAHLSRDPREPGPYWVRASEYDGPIVDLG